MSSPDAHHHQLGPSVLFENPDKSVVLIDIPRSIEEAQVLPGHVANRRLISSSPTETPWKTPEPKKGIGQQTVATPSAAVAELMTLESVKTALDSIKTSHAGPWCLPRVTRGTRERKKNETDSKESRKRKKATSDSDGTPDVIPEPFIPDQAHYLLGSIESQRETFLKTAPSFDLVVLDPPWPSRSVKRKRNSYATVYGMDEARDLLSQIPVASHLEADGLVAVWITNKAAVADLLTAPGGMFSQWGLELIGEWIWLKITRSGDPIIDVESQWRKPWERLLIARKKGSSTKLPIPTKVILGVPDAHSRKPNLRSLFADVLPENYHGLEVFSRNLTAGWWSWGDEVLHFQNRHHWIAAEDAEL
ncbi:MT-A70-domain-containing protein [Xylariaceae sp. FL0662B]|nr:MT-A70-domain-containing protein [Xylariaceae sp. FL0662B]